MSRDEAIQLWTNQEVSEEIRPQLEADLKQVLNITQSTVLHQRSYDIPELIRIILEAIEWTTALKGAAIIYLSAVVKKLGDKTVETLFEKRKKALEDKKVKPLKQVASVISKARQASPKKTVVKIGLPIPDYFFSASLDIKGETEEVIALEIAMFVLSAEELEQLINARSEGTEFLGGVTIEANSEGEFIARWKDQDFNKYEIRIGHQAGNETKG